jgi:hypothetical protein
MAVPSPPEFSLHLLIMPQHACAWLRNLNLWGLRLVDPPFVWRCPQRHSRIKIDPGTANSGTSGEK